MIKYGIKSADWEKIIGEIAKCTRVARIVLFGSRAMGRHSAGSDIDLALFGKAISFEDVNAIYLRLDDLNLPYEFDLVVYDSIQHVNLREHIERVGVELYTRY